MVDPDRLTGAAREMGGKIQSEIGGLSGSRRDAAEGRANEASGRAERRYGEVKDAVRQVAGDVADYAEDGYRTGKRFLQEGHEQSVEWPHASLVVAGLVGFGLGLLANRR
ncbi:CsbD family protein [Methylobacterium sp. C25]|uniref:CsbD family protein n=1 Tax=Methylobacterium sp. C25 TaxID=2721622 RepID=UPI001F16B797|nr:CsbD family protein [Methylobacterium sp. C25]MCE4226655.1 CsbD family protein [Methylobacterium sp. C25]